MLFENIENRSKKRNDNPSMAYRSVDNATSPEMFGDAIDYGVNNDASGVTPEWDAMKKRTGQKLNYLSMPVDEKAVENRFMNSFANYMVPKDTPERHRKNYALSDVALDDVVGDYYNGTLKESFNKKREESKKKGKEEYMHYLSVPGAKPEDAFKASMRADDPLRVVDETMFDVDDDELLKEVAPLASYGGYDAKEYVEKFVKPSLRDRMTQELVDENTPKSSAEYIMRSAFDNSLMGKIGSMGMKTEKGARNNRLLAAEGVANYDAGRVEDFAAGVGSLLIDSPIFSGLGAASSSVVGRATAKATEKLANTVLSRYTGKLVSKEFANAVAGKVIKDRLKNRIMQRATTQGLTLGTYDVANSVADDILYNSNVNTGKAIGAFAKGFTTGAAVGATGTYLKARTKGLTGGKKLLSSAGVLSAESAIFTAGGELDKLAHGVEIKPIDLVNDFGESAATLLTMRMANWRPKGAMQKLNAQGKVKDELQLSSSERQELREMNISPENFMSMIESELRMPSLNSSQARLLKENYAMLMANKKLSASAKSKLMYLVENKVTSTPPVAFDYKVEKGSKGIWTVSMLDAGGNLLEQLRFPNASNVKSHLLLLRGGIRKNRIAYYERELTSDIDSQNFLQEAGLYAKEKGVDADLVAEAMYKSARKEPLAKIEQKIINNIMARSSRYESYINNSLSDARREIELRYNLDPGALSYAVDKRLIDCSTAENKALDEYEAFVRSQVEKVKERSGEMSVEEAYEKSEISNADMRYRELEKYNHIQEQKYAGRGGFESVAVDMPEKLYKVPENKPGKVWSILGKDLSEETIKRFEKRGKELSEKFGHDIVFITDEHQIEVPDANDRNAIVDYNNRLRALGWVNNGKVYINLPNISDMAELEKTIVHEVIGHAGLKKVFGNYMYDFLEDVYKRADGTVLTGIKKMANKYKGFDMYTVTEEYLAHLVEKAYPNAQERNLLVRFKDFVRGMLVRSNLYKTKYRRVNEDDLKDILKAHVRYVLNGKERAVHRKEVFNRFPSSNLKEDGYYDRKSYNRDKAEMAKDVSYSRFVPKKLIDEKYYVNYPYYPEDVRAEIAKRFMMSDDELRKLNEGDNFRFDNERNDAAEQYEKSYNALEERLTKRYKRAQEYISLLNDVRKAMPAFDNNAQIERAFRREFGMDMHSFKRMFPTYDDFLLHKLRGGGNVQSADGAERADATYEQPSVIKELDDLKRYFTGPIDVINGAINDASSNEPVKLKKVSEQLGNAKLTPYELAKLEKALEDYTKMLLENALGKRKADLDSYGYESYKEKERARREFYRKEAEEYRRKYEDSEDDVPSDYLNN